MIGSGEEQAGETGTGAAPGREPAPVADDPVAASDPGACREDAAAGAPIGPVESPQRARNEVRALLRQAWRTAFLRRPRWEDLPSSPWIAAWLVGADACLELALTRIDISGPATFNWKAVLAGWYFTALLAWVCWLLVWRTGKARVDGPASAAALFCLAFAQMLVVGLLGRIASLPFSGSALLPAVLTAFSGIQKIDWAVYLAVLAWFVGALLTLLWRVRGAGLGARLLASLLLAGALAIETVHPPERYWYPASSKSAGWDHAASFRLTQEVIELQPQLLRTKLDALAAPEPGRVNLYAVTFAPYGSEDVFQRESDLVATLMQERFGAQARTLQLVNNPATARQWPWATPLNLQRAIEHIAPLMDRDRDILFIHLTSHGAKDGELSAALWPLQVDALTPGLLRRWLDDAGIRFRVISVSACYSGSWIEPLAGPGTLVMTAADADHTSYGCGSRSPLTYFGQAMYDEQLRHTWSFEKAHAAARPVIEQRERAAGKSDGYSNPQIRVGDGIRERLAIFEREREAASAAAPAPPAR